MEVAESCFIDITAAVVIFLEPSSRNEGEMGKRLVSRREQ